MSLVPIPIGWICVPNLFHFRDSFALLDFALVFWVFVFGERKKNEPKWREKKNRLFVRLTVLTKDFM